MKNSPVPPSPRPPVSPALPLSRSFFQIRNPQGGFQKKVPAFCKISFAVRDVYAILLAV